MDMEMEMEVAMVTGIDLGVFIYFRVLIFCIQGSEETEQRLLLPAPRLRPLGLLERGRF